MNLENFLKPRNVKKWERKGLIVIRFYGLIREWSAGLAAFVKPPHPLPLQGYSQTPLKYPASIALTHVSEISSKAFTGNVSKSI